MQSRSYAIAPLELFPHREIVVPQPQAFGDEVCADSHQHPRDSGLGTDTMDPAQRNILNGHFNYRLRRFRCMVLNLEIPLKPVWNREKTLPRSLWEV